VRVLALLTVVVWPHGLNGVSHRSVVRCPGDAACARLAALDEPFAPVPAGAVCSQIYGGPQVARVAGRYRGARVWATFRRRNGCETARWNRIAFLLR
jgi:hypothetical protein